ncbi:MAG: succinate dehydrogenase, cytochrome b556 subunit [Pseudomonadota bacterium]
MSATVKKKRPVYLNLVKIRLPLPGIVSIMHRVSGAILFLFLPVLLCLLQGSLESQYSYDAIHSYISYPLNKIILSGLIWGYLHHFCAGVRYLLLDLHCGIDLKSARSSSVLVLVISILLTLSVWWRLWL